MCTLEVHSLLYCKKVSDMYLGSTFTGSVTGPVQVIGSTEKYVF